jgi:hypothetical protein
MYICSQQSALCLVIYYTLYPFILNLSDSLSAQLPTAVAKFFRTFLFALGRFL